MIKKKKTNNASSKLSSVKKTQQNNTVVLQKTTTQKKSLPENLDILFEKTPSKDNYEQSLKSMNNLFVSTDCKKDSKTIFLNSIFISIVCISSNYKITEATASQKKSYFFNTLFTRPPPMKYYL